MSTASPPLASAPQLPEAPLSYRLARRVTEYGRLMRLDRPVGTWLLLWPALWALWIAGSGLRDQRLPRPRHRSARAAHARPAPRRAPRLARRGPGVICPPAQHCAVPGDAARPAHRTARRYRRAPDRLLPALQALLPHAAAVPRHLLRRL